MSRDALRREHDAATRELQAMAIARFRRSLRKVLKTVAERATRGLSASGSGVSVDDLGLLSAMWAKESDEELMPFLEEVFGAGAISVAKELNAQLAVVGPGAAQALVSRRAEQWLAEAANRVKGFGDEMWSQARASLLEGFSLGEGVEELSGRLTGLFDLLDWQAERIARTETMTAANQGALAEARALGDLGPTWREWLAELDSATDEDCAELDGVRVGIDEDFPGGAEPGEIHPNCRCTAIFGYPDEGSEATAVDTDTLDELAAAAQEDTMPKPKLATPPAPPPSQQRKPTPPEPPKPKRKGIVPNPPPQNEQPPYTVEAGAEGCPPEASWGLVDATGQTCTCWASQAEAEANIEPAPEMAALAEAFAEGLAPEAGAAGAFHSLMVIEGEETGDGRIFEPGSLTWRDMPIPVKWQKEEMAGHDGSVLVGNVTRIERVGSEIHGYGTLDLGGVDGAEAARLVEAGFLRGVSVDVDSVKDSDIELVWPEGEGEADGLEALFAEPEQIRFLAGRVSGMTLTPMPAFQEAFIELGDGADAPAPETVAAGAERFGPTGKSVSDAPWDGSASRFSDEQYRMAAAGCDGGDSPPKTDCFLPHHEPGGAVSRAGVHAAAQRAGALSGHPAESVARAKAHLRSHYTSDLGEDPPPSIGGAASSAAIVDAVDLLLGLESLDGLAEGLAALRALHAPPEPSQIDVLTASAIPVAPPAEWFEDPGFDRPTPLQVTAEGRVFGHAAEFGTCHIGYPGVCVTPPEDDDFTAFLLHEVETDDGQLVAVGNITMHGHAEKLPLRAAQQHYDDPRASKAQVVVGNDRFGIWVAGALKPDVEPADVRALRACALSGEWRRIGGKMRMIALAAVNVGGFPIPRTSARVVGGRQEALVAAGVLVPGRHRPEPDLSPVARMLAESIGRDVGSRAAALAAEVRA